MTGFIDINPPYLNPRYKSTVLRAPRKRLIQLPPEWFHRSPGPVFGRVAVRPGDNDLTTQHPGRPIGQFITLSGRVLDSDGRGVPHTLVEIWQANGAGRYVDTADPGLMPLDPNFTGAGRTLTDSSGHYRFRTIKPAAYPGRFRGMFRPAHIHVSVFGPDLGSRIITQCYFEGDPLLPFDAIAQSVGDPRGLDRLTARLNWDDTELGDVDAALAYDWDIVLRGREMTPREPLT
ncbi:dioxygenase family protein [Amycolatopsis pithecellobii]|uniref:Protocatechuate 3,4-dioxygenase subunit beta n=1 Tax=Amycolatopsis pithecellobii TaxID=664692 RepID=A0A6N7YJS2_9PSEU|nr:protocatechuate 3,4-dioxygenase subunit beta [Amycolatopsis pithecellobii]MTD53165.1 protocatechuate 3,4-dioxygenase subunit beta [Amycolatopsis pithecellobii]